MIRQVFAVRGRVCVVRVCGGVSIAGGSVRCACVCGACVCQEYAYTSVEPCGQALCCGLAVQVRLALRPVRLCTLRAVSSCVLCCAASQRSIPNPALLVSSSPAWIWHVQASISGFRGGLGCRGMPSCSGCWVRDPAVWRACGHADGVLWCPTFVQPRMSCYLR